MNRCNTSNFEPMIEVILNAEFEKKLLPFN